jgi:hypothetical protein
MAGQQESWTLQKTKDKNFNNQLTIKLYDLDENTEKENNSYIVFTLKYLALFRPTSAPFNRSLMDRYLKTS